MADPNQTQTVPDDGLRRDAEGNYLLDEVVISDNGGEGGNDRIVSAVGSAASMLYYPDAAGMPININQLDGVWRIPWGFLMRNWPVMAALLAMVQPTASPEFDEFHPGPRYPREYMPSAIRYVDTSRSGDRIVIGIGEDLPGLVPPPPPLVPIPGLMGPPAPPVAGDLPGLQNPVSDPSLAGDIDIVRGDPLVKPKAPPLVGEQVVIGVRAAGKNVEMTVRRMYVDTRVFSFPRYSDSKYGVRFVGMVNAVVTKTWGVVSEAGDLAASFSWSLYGVNAKGEIVHAMALTNGSMLAAFQGYLEGKYKLDTVGFIGDYALSQMGDWVVGNALKGVDNVAFALGWVGPLGITAETWYNAYDQLTGQTTYTGADYVSDVWAWAAGQAREQDALRRARVRGLF